MASILTATTKGTPAPATPSTVLGLPANKTFFVWGISGLTLIALADPLPNVAISFALLLILGVLLINSADYIDLLNAGLSYQKQSSPTTGGNRGFVL